MSRASTRTEPVYGALPEVQTKSADLARAFSLVRNVAPRVQLRVGHGALRVRAANRDLWLDAYCPASGVETGVATVNAATLTKALQVVGGTLTIEADGGTLSVADADTHLGIAEWGDDETMRTRPETPMELHDLDDDDVAAIRQVATVASGDDARPILTAVRIGEGTAVATDSYRLAWAPISYTGPTILLPAHVVARLAPGWLHADDDHRPTWVGWATPDLRVTCRVIDGEFPNWRQLIPSVFGATVRAPKGALLTALAHASVFATTEPVVLAPDDNGVAVTCTGHESFTFRRVIPGRADTRVAFNPDFLASIVRLAAVGDEAVLFGSGTKLLGPWMIGDADKMSGLVMPVRVS